MKVIDGICVADVPQLQTTLAGYMNSGMRVKTSVHGGLALIKAMPMVPGRPIALEFDNPIPGGHSCGGLGKNGYCWWVTPEEIRSASA